MIIYKNFMSSKSKKQKKFNINLISSKKLNLFPEDFFSSFDSDKTEDNIENQNKNEHPNIINSLYFENYQKMNLYSKNSRNINSSKEMHKNKSVNIIKFDINTDFSFQAPSSPVIINKINNNKNSISVINKNNSLKPLFKSPLNKKIKENDIKSNYNCHKKLIINKSDNKANFYKSKYDELFNETNTKSLKYINNRNNNLYNDNIFFEKDKEKKLRKNKYSIKIINNNIYNKKENEKNFNMTSKNDINKTHKNFYRPSTPVINSKKVSKIPNIENQKEIALKSYSSKYLKNKNSIYKTEIKIKSKMKNKPNININKFNKRAISLNNLNKNIIKNNSKKNLIINKVNKKIKIQKKIKNSLNKIFRELPKNCEDNPVIFNKFNTLIKNMKNIQKIILNKKVSFCNNKALYNNYKNIESEKNINNVYNNY